MIRNFSIQWTTKVDCGRWLRATDGLWELCVLNADLSATKQEDEDIGCPFGAMVTATRDEASFFSRERWVNDPDDLIGAEEALMHEAVHAIGDGSWVDRRRSD